MLVGAEGTHDAGMTEDPQKGGRLAYFMVRS